MQGIAISSYQGGHIEYFTYLLERLRDEGIGHVRVYGGGGGVIVPDEIDAAARARRRPDLLAAGRAAAGPAEDGQHDDRRVRRRPVDAGEPVELDAAARRLRPRTWPARSPRSRTARRPTAVVADRRRRRRAATVPVLGITGTGGSGKSSLTDELLRRFRLDQADKLRIAVIAVDPTRRRGGGALLGDRIRMNAIDTPQRVLPLAGDPRRPGQRGARRRSTASSTPRRRGAPTSSSSRRPASARATRRSCRSSTCRCT